VTAIRSVRFRTNKYGDLIERPHFELYFSDGDQWTTTDDWRTPEPNTDRQVTEVIAAENGVALEEWRTSSGR
jgi:hypothetical protein